MTEQSTNQPLAGYAVSYKGSGGYEVIEYLERTVREPSAEEVRIAVKAAAVSLSGRWWAGGDRRLLRPHWRKTGLILQTGHKSA